MPLTWMPTGGEPLSIPTWLQMKLSLTSPEDGHSATSDCALTCSRATVLCSRDYQKTNGLICVVNGQMRRIPRVLNLVSCASANLARVLSGFPARFWAVDPLRNEK